VLGRNVTDAALEDWRTAPVSEKTRAMLGFLQKMTLEPDQLDASDVEPLEAAGISRQAVDDAIHIALLFDTIARVADALHWAIPPQSGYDADADFLLKVGYKP
jgi:alkylhydroperoxidase family enzyme